MVKLCLKCNTEKNISEFHKNKSKKDGLSTYCKECRKIHFPADKQYKRDKNKQRIYETKYRKRKRNDDKVYRIQSHLGSRFYAEVKKAYAKKIAQLAGCTKKELKIHIESQFTGGMSWDNYGEWHVDHYIPCAYFDHSNEEEVKICWNYRNLKPSWAIDNLLKTDNLPKDYIEHITRIKQKINTITY